MSTQDGPPREYMREALETYDQRRAFVGSEKGRIKGLEGQPCPPDPELDALFKDFARLMPESEAVPLVEEHEKKVGPDGEELEPDEEPGPDSIIMRIIKRNVAGYQMGKAGRVLPTPREIDDHYRASRTSKVYSTQEVGKGWPIRAKHLSGVIPHSHQDHELINAWTGLVIDTEGRVWFARDTRDIAPDGRSWNHYKDKEEVVQFEEEKRWVRNEDGEIVLDTQTVPIKRMVPAPVTVKGDISEYPLYASETPLGANVLEYLSSDIKTGLVRAADKTVTEDGEERVVGGKVEGLSLKRREPKLDYPNPPTGRSLREAIIWYCGITNTAPDDLPEMLAKELAAMIRKAEAEEEARRKDEHAEAERLEAERRELLSGSN